MEKDHVLENIFGDWLGSIYCMSAKVAIQFPSRSGGGSKRKGDHRISKFDSKRGSVGIIRRGRSQGCGGHGGHHAGSNRHDPTNGWFHGVECSDFRRSFFGKEFDKAWKDGRLYVFKNHISDKDTRYNKKVQQGGKDYGKELALVPYSGVDTSNDN